MAEWGDPTDMDDQEYWEKYHRHNSDVAEMLFAVITLIRTSDWFKLKNNNPELYKKLNEWWEEHKRMDDK